MSTADHGRALLAKLKGDGGRALEERMTVEREAAQARVDAQRAEHERHAREEHARLIAELAGEREREAIERADDGVVPIAVCGAEVGAALEALGHAFDLAIAGEPGGLLEAWERAEERVTRARVAIDTQPYERGGREIARFRNQLVNLRWELRAFVRRACERAGVSAPDGLEGLPR